MGSTRGQAFLRGGSARFSPVLLCSLRLHPDGRQHLLRLASGDARAALNTLELAAQIAPRRPDGTLEISLSIVEEAAQRRTLLYDKTGEEHYALTSALHKSLRDGDPDAALYWLARMLLSMVRIDHRP